MPAIQPGSIVRCRSRDWVLLPSDRDDLILLRPLAGAADRVTALHKGLTDLVGYDLPDERVTASTFEPPSPDHVSDATGAQLLWQAARLALREGATPFRSLGRISIRPRVFQFVPLLMALRLNPVRLFIADDVGVGKTIEALLVARELLDRGEIRRMVVLCPPYLCDQWQRELTAKFNLDAVVVRSGTISQLERNMTGSESVYRAYPIQVASIDFLKSDRNRHQFLQNCPELVIVDEAHGAAESSDRNASQQQRHRLLHEIAADSNRHVILLTATPHSGIPQAFQSLLSLLRPEFRDWDVSSLDESKRITLARHFVQRVRRDIERDWDGEHCFPKRESADETYALSPAYRALFSKTYDFCAEIVRTGHSLAERQRRVRYWAALALLRCVMSSPAAALAALEARHDRLAGEDEDEVDFRGYVFESDETQTDDDAPTPPVESAEATLPDNDRRRLRELGRLAAELAGARHDTKLTACAAMTSRLLTDGLNPIIWCRYIATAEYVAKELSAALRRTHPTATVTAITSRLGDEERRAKIEEIDVGAPRVLVATDCLSEGINLQDRFSAAVHYDLPWNPNRLEQREGRVDRYGQAAKVVKAVRFFGADNPVDGVVIRVLLDKAREIRRTLGTHVPVPEESESVTQAVLNALFLRGGYGLAGQLSLFDSTNTPEVAALHRQWDEQAKREGLARTRFAQRALKPDEVRKELEATDAVLGDPTAVRDFVLSAAQRLGLHIEKDRKRADVYRIAVAEAAIGSVPDAVRFALPAPKTGHWAVSFVSPTPEGADYLGRNHPFVAALSRYLMEQALARTGQPIAARCGVIRTRQVETLTTVLLLRVRYLVERGGPPLLAEEVRVQAFTGRAAPRWLDEGDALRLLADARPEANVPIAEKRALAETALKAWRDVQPALEPRIGSRAEELKQAHKRIRAAVRLGVRDLDVEPVLPADLLGLLVLQPHVGR